MIIRDNFCQFFIKNDVVTTHLNCLDKMVKMRGHNIMVLMRNKKNYPSIIIKYSSYLDLWGEFFFFFFLAKLLLCPW